MLLAVPVSFGIALFLTEVSPRWMRGPIASAIELLAGIPSIIYGMWGLFVFVPFMSDHIEPWLIANLGPLPIIGSLFDGPPLGIGMLTAGIILAVMVIPFISSIMRDVFSLVPPPLREAAFGLGATRWEVVWGVVLPYTRTAVVGGIFLGLGRALGETMAVTFVLGNAHRPEDLAARAGQFHRGRDRQRIHRSRFRYLSIFADCAWLRAVRGDVHRAGRRQAHADAAQPQGGRLTWQPPRPRARRRHMTNYVALGLATTATVFGLFWLVWILLTTLFNGFAAINLRLITQMTPPPGSDGGLLNAIFGSTA